MHPGCQREVAGGHTTGRRDVEGKSPGRRGGVDGTSTGRRRGVDGTSVGRRWDGGGTSMGRRWDVDGTSAGRRQRHFHKKTTFVLDHRRGRRGTTSDGVGFPPLKATKTGNGIMSGPKSTLRWRPYRVEYTGSLPTSEVKRRRARLVLGWGTAREDLRVLPALFALPHCATRTPHYGDPAGPRAR